MPTYFHMSLLFSRGALYPDFIADFDAALDLAGLRFLAGYLEDRDLPQAEIAAWNQKKLEADFVLGLTTHCSRDYKQTLYRFGDYSEVRGFWMNRYPKRSAFTYTILIPQSEVLAYNLTFRAQAVSELTALAKELWQFPPVEAVQTGLELSDPPLSLAELRRGVSPDASPFVIVAPDCHPYDDGSQATPLTGGRPGLLLLDTDMLSPDLPGSPAKI